MDFSPDNDSDFEHALAGRLASIAGSAFPEAAEGCKCSAVLVPLLRESGAWHLLYTRRCDELPEHGGQIAFPGGQCEPEDQAPFATALREACEELGIPAQSIRLLGMLNPVDTTTGFLISPVVGVLAWPLNITLEQNEVREYFTVPLEWLRTDGKPAVRPVPGREGRHAVYFQPFEGREIWGATAKITQDLLQRLSGAGGE
jgi:8-oxo-dGTP pyrophosphatase MutT (NUDIX family)